MNPYFGIPDPPSRSGIYNAAVLSRISSGRMHSNYSASQISGSSRLFHDTRLTVVIMVRTISRCGVLDEWSPGGTVTLNLNGSVQPGSTDDGKSCLGYSCRTWKAELRMKVVT